MAEQHCCWPIKDSSKYKRLRSCSRYVLFCLCALTAVSGCGLTGYGASRMEERKPVYHVVRSGETIRSIGEHYGVSPLTLVRLNGLRHADRLTVGKKILVGYRHSSPAYKPQSKPSEVVRASSRTPAFVSKGRLAWPLSAARVASTFGPRNGDFHDGVDFAAVTGTPIFSAHRGQVIYADNDISGYGNLVIVRGEDRLNTVYAHNDEILVREGQRVERGQQIATVGMTGHANGPHLHFEVRARDSKGRYVAIDPWPLLAEPGKDIRPRYRVNESLIPVLARIFQ
jgi:murein DD-endopeptidase MepM/ murein hydrolase activator NlpD